MAHITHIETGFQRQLKTGAAFVDLSAAYYSVWREGLMLKLMNAVACSNLYGLLDNKLVNGYFQVFVREKNSRWRRLKNGFPQGSAFAPILLNLCMSDIRR
jgi:hypothetical protein